MKTPDFLQNEHYQDRYFDVVNAIAEAHHVYFEGCQLQQHLQQQASLAIGETGFGAGRVLLGLLCFLDALAPHFQGEKRDIAFASVELHPLEPARLAGILQMFAGQLPTIDVHIQHLVQAYQTLDLQATSQWQKFSLQTACGPVSVRLWFGEALEMVQQVSPRDVWFLEGHGPKANPAMWRPELLLSIGEKTKVGGHCATFTVAGHIRRDLRAAGFNTRRLPGFGGKKEVLQGQKRPPQLKAQTQLQCVPYQPQWAQEFQRLKQWLTQTIPIPFVGLEHIGSTSIPGMWGQPELDLALISSSHWQAEALHQALISQGYQVRQERDQRCYHPAAHADTVLHRLFLYTPEAAELHQQLLLRDYLRQQPARCDAYSQLKQTFIQRHPNDLKAYTGAKTRFLNRLSAEARSQSVQVIG